MGWNMRLVCAALLYLSCFTAAANSEARNSETRQAMNPESLNRTISITDAGVYPSSLRIANEDISVFILNDTSDSLISFEIDFGTTLMHCNNKNIKTSAEGKAWTIKPLGPRDFIATCFHEKGRYPLKFVGLKGKGALSGEVILE
jgi:hypothetical protein